jgi:hypothetical protein
MAQQQQQPTQSSDALFNAPAWGARLLTLAAMMGVLALVSLVVGVGLAIVTQNMVPLGLGLVLAAFLGLPAMLLQWLTRKSLDIMYGSTRVQDAGPQQTIVNVERPIKIDGKMHNFKTEQFQVDAPPDQVARMMAWVKNNPTRISRTQVMENAKVSQSTWERVMKELENLEVVVNMGKSGYKTLDDKLDELDARL